MPVSITVPVSAGELIDKIVILEIKLARIDGAPQREHVRRELNLLETARDQTLIPSARLTELTVTLKSINESLWVIEDEIRVCEREGTFDERFVELARSVYRTNDRRSDIKLQINRLVGSELTEAKQYERYD